VSLIFYLYKQKFSSSEEMNGLATFLLTALGNSASFPIGWWRVFANFPAAFLYHLRIAQRLSNCLWAFPRGFSIPFEQWPTVVQQPLKAFPSGIGYNVTISIHFL
jgi:hypothetical protein